MKTEPRQHEMMFGSRCIRFTLRRAPRRGLRVVVTPDMQVQAHVPLAEAEERVLAVVKAKLPWIARTLDKVELFQPLAAPKRYVSGETFLYLGRQYRLRIERGTRTPVKLTGRFLLMSVPPGTPPESVRTSIENWYRQRAREVFARYVAACQEITRRHGIPEAQWSVRTMQRRWGSCGAGGQIIFNSRLVQVPVHCIEYVIMHELCHLKVHSHSRAFYSLLGRCLPDWSRRKELLAHQVL